MGVYRDARKDFVWQKDFPALSAILNGSKKKSAEYQQQLKELEAAKTEQENLQIIQLVRSMNMKPDEFAAFLRSGALNAAPTVTPYHKQEDAADET